MKEQQLEKERIELLKRQREVDEKQPATPRQRRWDTPERESELGGNKSIYATPSSSTSEWEKEDDNLIPAAVAIVPKRSRWDATPVHEPGKRSRWDATPVLNHYEVVASSTATPSIYAL